MTKKAFVLGGTGLIGRALVPDMLAAGWELTVASRSGIPADARWAAEVEHVLFDRETASLRDIVRSGYDTLIDIVAYEPEAARQLSELRDRIGAVIVVSTMSVYADDHGRSMDDADTPDHFPDLPQPIPESQRTVKASSATYSTKKVAIEKALLADAKVPVTIVRPGMIYGVGDKSSREWFFVKRVRDGRRHLVLAYEGATPVSVIASRNLAELIRLAANTPGTRIVNAADPQPQTARSIGFAVSKVLDHEWDELLLQGPSPQEPIGETPWSSPGPFVIDIRKAKEELGYEGRVEYEDALTETCEWLLSATAQSDWTEVLPNAQKYYGSLFDYGAEDELLSHLG
ncbi:MAG: NAD-dependent epimerase/dehydratase family protein [Actinomycetota bacterium]|nr:NAD-dependent epimerase/dehydratase family protein [Actinomycetota bacterium]